MNCALLLSDAGNLYVVLPVMLAIGVWLRRALDWAAALRLWALLAGLTGLVGGLKYAAWSDWGRVHATIRSHYHGAPSGHAALAVFVYGGVAMLLWRGAYMRLVAVLFGVLALAIGFSRVALGAHPIGEVIGGQLIALPFLALMLPKIRHCTPGQEAVLAAIALCVMALAVGSGVRFHAEQRIFVYLQSVL